MTETKAENDLANNLVENWRTFITIIGSISGLCYVIGFIVDNIYLGQYGVHDLELIRPQYFAAGLLYLLLSMLIGIVPLVTIHLLRDLRQRGQPIKRWQEIAFVAASLLILVTVIWAISIFLTGAEPAQNSVQSVSARQVFIWIFLPASQIVLWFPLVLGAGILALLRKSSARESNPGNRPARLKILIQSVLIVPILVATLISFFIFAIWVFPYVSSALGGAAPINVRLLLSDEGVAVFHNLPIKSQDRFTEPLTLIDQSGDHLLLLYGSNQILDLSTRAITGIIYGNP